MLQSSLKTSSSSLVTLIFILGFLSCIVQSLEQSTNNETVVAYNNTMDDGTDEPVPAAAAAGPVIDFDRISTRGYVHGWTMAIAWAFLVPVAIGSSLLRDCLGHKWILIHQYSNILAFVLTTVGFGLVVKNIQDLSVFGLKHFSADVPHRLIGLIVYILMVLQVVTGMFRPHLPKSVDASSTTNNDNDDVEQNPPPEQPQSIPTETKTLARRVFELEHRFLGLAVLAMALYNCHGGIRRLEELESYDYSHLIIAMWSTLGGVIGIVAVLFFYKKNSAASAVSTKVAESVPASRSA